MRNRAVHWPGHKCRRTCHSPLHAWHCSPRQRCSCCLRHKGGSVAQALGCCMTVCSQSCLLSAAVYCWCQELEGRGNHYHFILPEDLAINATHLLQELGGPSRSNAALEPKGECIGHAMDAWSHMHGRDVWHQHAHHASRIWQQPGWPA